MLIFSQLVVVDDSSETEDTPTRGQASAATRAVPKPRAAPKVKNESKIPALTIASDSKTPQTKMRVKTEPSSGGFTPDSSDDVKNLPALVGPTWESLFLPAAYRALYCSPDPMMFAAKGESAASEIAAVKSVQAILDDVHPGNTLKVVWGDKVCKKVRRTVFGVRLQEHLRKGNRRTLALAG
jgi:hypothetical protein